MNNDHSVRRKQNIQRSSKKKLKPLPENSVDNNNLLELRRTETKLKVDTSTTQNKKKNILCNSSNLLPNKKLNTNNKPTLSKTNSCNSNNLCKKKWFQNFQKAFRIENSSKARMEGNYNGDYCDFTKFSVKKMEKKLYLLIACNGCKKFYNATNEPRIYDKKLQICSRCISSTSNLSLDYVNKNFPLNYGYLSAILNNFSRIGIFDSEIIFVNELQRSLKMHCNQPCSSINLRSEMLQNMHHIDDVIDNIYNEVNAENEDHNLTLLETIESLEKFKRVIAMSQNSDKLMDCFSRAYNRLEGFNYFFGSPHQKIIGFDKDSLYEHVLKTYPMESSIVLSQTTYDDIVFDELKLFAYVDVHNRRLYSNLDGSMEMIFLPAFQPKFPSRSSFRIGNFFLFDASYIKKRVNGYFDIKVSATDTIDVATILEPRLFIFFGFVDLSWDVASLFLGNNDDSFLETEIDVTEEKVIFKHFPSAGIIIQRIRGVPLKKIKPQPVRQGMVVLESIDNIYKLIIYKYNIPTKHIQLCPGHLIKFSLALLRKIPLGRYKINSCGICIMMNDKAEPELPC